MGQIMPALGRNRVSHPERQSGAAGWSIRAAAIQSVKISVH